MKDKEIDDLLKTAARPSHEVEAVSLQRVAASLQSSMRPVHPLPPTWVLTGALALLCAAVALLGAGRAGFDGFEKMDLMQRALIFATLGVLTCLSGIWFAHEMIPGSRRWLSPGAVLGLTVLALLGVFALLFRDYHVSHFVSAGTKCLITGVIHAIPAGLLSWLVLRRGFAVNSVSAGLAAGALAGLAGVGVLELHCVNFQAIHVLVWHTAVIPVSGASGALVAWALRFRVGHGSHERTVSE